MAGQPAKYAKLGGRPGLIDPARALLRERDVRMAKPLARLVPGATLLCLTALAASSLVGCADKEEHAQLDATMTSDGYALFAVDNDRQQRNDVTFRVKDAEPGATYALLYSPDAPTSAGWFQLDVSSRSRCGGDLGPHCEIQGGFGYLVDFVKVPEGATEIVLRDDRCGCDAKNDSKSWTGHWAVMRIERTNKPNQMTVDVWAKTLQSIATEPDITQLL